MKTNKSTAPKSTELTDATKSKVSTLNPQVIMHSDNSINSTLAVNSDNTVNSNATVNTNNLFGNEPSVTMQTPATPANPSTPTAASAEATEQPKQQRIGKQQRKSDYADFKTAFLTPSKLEKRHPVNIEDRVWAKLERIARILGDRDTTVSSYANAILTEHLKLYADDIEIWRKL